MIHCRARLPSVLAFAIALIACASAPDVEPTPIIINSSNSTEHEVAPRGNGLSTQIKDLVELGTPPFLLRALDLIRSQDLAATEFGRAMTAVAVVLMQKLYPEIRGELPNPDPPVTHTYTKILRDAERGAYTPAPPNSSDYLEHVLPFLALLDETRSERLSSAIPDLERAANLNSDSSLDPFFRGLVAERQGQLEAALTAYDRARHRSSDCYPATVAAARIMATEGRTAEALAILNEISIRYPDNELIKRQLAKTYYLAKDWSRAGPAVAEILRLNPRDLEFMLMRAHALVEQGALLQAQPLLDAVAMINAENRLYLFLRARVQAEGYRNRDSALNYLRAILQSYPDDLETLNYAVKLLFESSRPEDVEEGRSLLRRLVDVPNPALASVELALKDAITRSAWAEAVTFLDYLLANRRSTNDLRWAVTVYTGLKDNDKALEKAAELYSVPNPADDIVVLYVNSLLGLGRNIEASRIIEERLASLTTGSQKSKLYYARSRLRLDEEAVMSDLRSSLFEDPRNLEALIAMLEIYRARKDDRRAVFYLKQALAIDPDSQILRRYALEYDSLMN